MARPKLHDEALRTKLLDRAAELLSSEGPEALSLRRLAADVGTSTTAVYSLFGGKPGLLAAVYDEAVRRFALADPHLYGVMFSPRAPGFEPDSDAVERSKSTFAPLVDAVRRAIDRGQLPPCNPVQVATACWAAAHGVVSLELGSFLPSDAGDASEVFAATLRSLTAGWDPAS